MAQSISSPATRIIPDAKGRTKRCVQEYLLTGGPDEVEVRVGETRFRVGGHASNDLVITDPSVSRFHLEIEATADGYRLRDLGSTNGTWIDGLRVVEAFVPDAARLRLGEVTLGFRLSGTEKDLPTSTADRFHGVLGRSPAMRELFAQLQRVAASPATVLLQGESGTGKERIAAALHQASPRAQGPFVVLDCAAIPRSLMESELFGHERGAFTGAHETRAGHFEEADGGTLFLDEIGELPLDLQPKLLRVLETRQVRRLGGSALSSVDVRVIGATNRDLGREVNRGTFREDLYYRLAVVKLEIAPLRERPEDIPLLVEHFVCELLQDDPVAAQRTLGGISAQNWARLKQLPWSGNVRELRNFIERTLILSDVGLDSRAFSAPSMPVETELAGVELDKPFTAHKAEIVSRFERTYLLSQLAQHGNNVSAAARASGLDRMNFKRLLRKYR